MTLSRETELGTISVSNIIFAQLIAEAFNKDACKGRIWPATRRGRQIGSDQKFSISDFASCIEVEYSDDGENIDIVFSVIVRFGTSIRSLTNALADYVADAICQRQGRKPNQIRIRITGVRSRQVARRNLEVVKSYASE